MSQQTFDGKAFMEYALASVAQSLWTVNNNIPCFSTFTNSTGVET